MEVVLHKKNPSRTQVKQIRNPFSIYLIFFFKDHLLWRRKSVWGNVSRKGNSHASNPTSTYQLKSIENLIIHIFRNCPLSLIIGTAGWNPEHRITADFTLHCFFQLFNFIKRKRSTSKQQRHCRTKVSQAH